MKLPKRFETKRLILRPSKVSDAKNVYAYASDPEVIRFLAFKKHKSIKDAEEFLKSVKEDWGKRGSLLYAICLKKSGKYIGGISLGNIKSFKPVMGYVLCKPYWGEGYTAEAAKALMKWALAQSHIHRVWAFCDVENSASARVMEKAGMKREGLLKRWAITPNISDEPRDCFVYAKTK